MSRPAEDPLRPLAARLATLAEAQPGAEVCGLVVGAVGGAQEIWPMPNAASHPSRAFALAPLDLLAAMRRLDREGLVLRAVYHSHLAGGAELSPTDIEQALAGGEPLLPGVAQVVVELSDGRAVRVRAHRLAGRRFEATDLWADPG